MRFLVLTSALIFLSIVRADNPHGLEIILKVFRQFLSTQPNDLKLGEGVHLVSTKSENDARSNVDDGSTMGVVENYLKNHEVRIRLQELMPGEGFGRAFKTAMDEVEGKDESSARAGGGGGGGKGGGKGGDGGGGIMLMGLMMGKMLAALGIGGVGLLAMKALMVSALALMLSIIIGLKKLVHTEHDDGGHTVIHAGGHGHHDYRKKREAAEMAYRAWEELKTR